MCSSDLYLPRPTSVNAGQARSIWVKRCLNKASHITSPEYWDLLAKFHPVKTLVENEDGFFILEQENQNDSPKM